jgi:hypothetical protein
MWCKEHSWNLCVLQKGLISGLVFKVIRCGVQCSEPVLGGCQVQLVDSCFRKRGSADVSVTDINKSLYISVFRKEVQNSRTWLFKTEFYPFLKKSGEFPSNGITAMTTMLFSDIHMFPIS